MNKMITSILMVSIFGFRSLFAMAGGPNPNQQLFLGAATGNFAQVDAALKQPATNIDATFGLLQQTALFTAVIQRNYAMAKELLKRGANPNIANTSGSTPLHIAVLGRQPDMVELLLKNGADPTLRDNTHRTPVDLLRLFQPALQNERRIQEIRQHFTELMHPASEITSATLKT